MWRVLNILPLSAVLPNKSLVNIIYKFTSAGVHLFLFIIYTTSITVLFYILFVYLSIYSLVCLSKVFNYLGY